MALAGKDAQIYVTGSSTSMTEEAMDELGSGTPVLQWQVTDHARDLLDPTVTFTVEVSTDSGSSWSTASPSDYTIRYLVGAVEFDSDPFSGSTSGNDVRISGSYLPYYSVLEGFSEDLEYSRDLYDTTQFQDLAMRRGAEGPLDISGSFSLNRVLQAQIDDTEGTPDEPTLREVLLGNETASGSGGSADVDHQLAFRVEPNASQSQMLAAWVKLSDESLSTSVGSKQEREFSMSGDVPTAAMATQVAAVADAIG
jgi:hypothetical protein